MKGVESVLSLLSRMFFYIKIFAMGVFTQVQSVKTLATTDSSSHFDQRSFAIRAVLRQEKVGGSGVGVTHLTLQDINGAFHYFLVIFFKVTTPRVISSASCGWKKNLDSTLTLTFFHASVTQSVCCTMRTTTLMCKVYLHTFRCRMLHC